MQKARKDPRVFPMLIRTLHQRGIDFQLPKAGILLDLWFPPIKGENHSPYLPLLSIPPELPGSIKWNQTTLSSHELDRPVTHRGVTVTFPDPWSTYHISVIKDEYLKTRINSLFRKADDLSRKVNAIGKAKQLFSYFKDQGIPIPSRYRTRLNKDLPLRFWDPLSEVLQREFEGLLTIILKVEDPEFIGNVDVREYVPDPLLFKYFRTYEQEKTIHISSIALETLRHLKINQNETKVETSASPG